MYRTAVVDAPGKINLSLDITGVREDGYHSLNTIMQSVDLCDTVTITRLEHPGIYISCDRPRIPCDETNYAHIAARKFFDWFGLGNPGIAIDIQKRLPSQAGLAGGSADAAGVLVGLNTLFEAGADPDVLCRIGKEVGADVPFCILGGTRQAQGIGDEFTVLPAMPHCFILIAKPEAGISTPEAYRRYDQRGVQNRPDIDYLIRQLRIGNLRDLASSMYNVLEEVADLEILPVIERKMIGAGAFGCMMSGSGSAVFGIFDSRSRARHCMRKLYDFCEGIFICHPVDKGVAVLDLRD